MIVEHGNLRPVLKAGPIGKFQSHILVIVQNRDVDGRLSRGHAIFSMRIQSLQCWLRKLGSYPGRYALDIACGNSATLMFLFQFNPLEFEKPKESYFLVKWKIRTRAPTELRVPRFPLKITFTVYE